MKAFEKANKDGKIKEFNEVNESMHRQLWQRVNDSGPLRIYSNGDWDWDYVKGSGKLPTIKGASISKQSSDGRSSTGYTRDVITNRDFKSLSKEYITKDFSNISGSF